MKIKTGEIKTRDIWQSAYILAKGGRLEDIRLNENNGKLVTFVFEEDPQVHRLKREFTLGHAQCNVAQLRASMIHLKQEVFQLIGRY